MRIQRIVHLNELEAGNAILDGLKIQPLSRGSVEFDYQPPEEYSGSQAVIKITYTERPE